MNNSCIEFLVTLFLGAFGVHKFIEGDIKMGGVYFFTCGLFGVGWIYDVFKSFLKMININNSQFNKSLMGYEGIKAINEGKIPNIKNTNLVLSNDEFCCFMDKAYTFEDKTITTGYTGKGNGISLKIAKGITYRTNGGNSKAIRETIRTTYDGILYITSKRVIFTSSKNSFDKPFEKITAIEEMKDGLIIQIGSNTYSIILDTHNEFMKVFNLVKSKN